MTAKKKNPFSAFSMNELVAVKTFPKTDESIKQKLEVHYGRVLHVSSTELVLNIVQENTFVQGVVYANEAPTVYKVGEAEAVHVISSYLSSVESSKNNAEMVYKSALDNVSAYRKALCIFFGAEA